MRKLILFTLFLLIPIISSAESLTFAWDTYPESASITGFHLWQSKQSGSYSISVATFPNTATTGSITKPTNYGRFYYVLTAFYTDTSVTPNIFIESDNSNEVSTVIKPKSPVLKSIAITALNVVTKPVTEVVDLVSGKKNLKIKN